MTNTLDQKALAAALDFVLQYGGRCRDCADENGVCPASGLPCGGRSKATQFVLRALAYGTEHNFIANPFSASLPAPEPVAWIAGDGSQTHWRVWKDGECTWTDDREKATRFSRREDAEAVHYDDDDVWVIVQLYASPPLHQGLREAVEAIGKAIKTERDLRFCPGEDCSDYDNGVDDGFDLAIVTFNRIARAALQSQPAPSGETK